MSILDKSSLVMIPSGYKEDVLYSVKPRNGEGDFTFTRASTGTRVNADGYIEDVPCNIVQYSEDYTQWTKSANNTLVSGQTSPINTNTATAFQHNGTTAEYYIFRAATLPSANVTMSAYLKKGTKNWVIFRVGNICLQYFDIENEVLGNNVFGAPISYNFVDAGNDWVRLDMTVFGNGASNNFIIYSAESGSNATPTGLSGDLLLYVWGAQVVKGNAPKPYIKTTDRLNIPRLDYSGGATTPTLLLEGQRTNTIVQSEDLSIGTILSNATVTTDQTTSPDSTDNADKVTYGSGSGFFYKQTNISAASTYSVFLKYDDYQYFQLMGTGDVDHYANFDILNGTVGNVGSQSTASIEDYGNGWYRCILNMIAGTFAGAQRVYKVSSLTSGCSAGGGGAGSVFAWGLQLESGAFATSYIPTLGTSVTRVKDFCIKQSVTDLIGQTEGVVNIKFKKQNTDSYRIFSLFGTSTSNRIGLYTFNDNLNVFAISGGVSQFDTTVLSSIGNGVFNIAVQYKFNDYKVYVNGSEVYTNTSANVPASLEDILFAQTPTGNLEFNHKIYNLSIFKEALTDDELETLTTI